jgi:hypothetical protein
MLNIFFIAAQPPARQARYVARDTYLCSLTPCHYTHRSV